MRILTEGVEQNLFGDLILGDGSFSNSNSRIGGKTFWGKVSAPLNNLSEFYTRFWYHVYDSNDSYMGMRTRLTIINANTSNTTAAQLRWGYAGFDDRLILRVYQGSTYTDYPSTFRMGKLYGALFELHYRYSNTAASDNIEFKIDGVKVLSHSAQTAFAAPYQLTRINYGSNQYEGYWDDIAINDTTGGSDNSWCGSGHTVALNPDQNISVNFTNPNGDPNLNYQYLGDTSANTYIESDVTNATDVYRLASRTLAPSDTITHVRVRAFAQKLNPDSPGIALGLQPSGSAMAWTTDLQPGTDYKTMNSQQYTTRPGGGAWQHTDLTNLQAGVKAE
jgi:hypothetical protein